MFKKITSVFLCFVILISCSFGLPNYKASAAALGADVTNPGWDTTDLELIKTIDFEATNADYLLDKDPLGNPYSEEYLHISSAQDSKGDVGKVLRIKPKKELQNSITQTIALAHSYVTNTEQYLYSIPTKPGTTYRISFDIRKEETKDYFKFYYYCGNENYYGRKENEILNAAALNTTNVAANNWQKMEYYITADNSTGKLAFYFNVGSTPVETLIDNITFEKVLSGVNGTTKLSYCEHQYNLLENKNLVSTEKIVTEIPVEKGVKYTFAADIAGGADDKAYLSFDANGATPISKTNSKDGVYFTGTSSGRQAINFTTDTTGKIYLVTENNSGSLKLTDPYLFRTYSKAIEANLLGKAMGKETKPKRTENTDSNVTDLSNDKINGGTELTVNNGEAPITENFRGVNGVYHLYNGMTDLYNRTYTEEQTEAEFNRLSDMGVKTVRSFYGSSLAYDNQEKKLTYNTKDLDTFYKNCKALAERGIEVGISPNWNFDGFLNYRESNVNNVDILYGPGIAVKPPAGGYDPATAYQTDEFKETMANYTEFVKQSVFNFKNEGITNIKYMFAYTECNNLFKNGTENFRNYDIIFEYYKAATLALEEGLRLAGAREKGSDNYISIVGPCDTSVYDDGYTNENFVSELTRRVLSDSQLKDIVDIIGSHNGYDRYYPDAETAFGSDYVPSFEDDTYAERAKRMLSGTKNLAAESGKEYWVDEYNVSLKLGEIDNTNNWKGTALASMITSVMNIGASNVFVWSIADQQWPNSMINNNDSFTNGLQSCGFMRSMLDSYTPYASYYAGSLLTKYIGKGKVYSVSDTSANQLYTSYIERDDGHITLLVVNYNKNGQSFNASFGKALGGKTFYKYVYNPTTVNPTEDATMINYSAIATGVNDRLSDTLSYGDVSIYTTKCELDQVQDIAEFKGTSVRYKGEDDAQYKNGLRFKFNIKNSLLEEGAFDGYTVVEYGFLVMQDGLLEKNDLTLDTAIIKNGKTYKPSKGVAYNTDTGKDIVFKSYADSRDFTAVLYNIGYNSSSQSINYSAYGRKYSARVYAKLRRGNNEKYIYDDSTETCSIFDVFEAVLSLDEADVSADKVQQLREDQERINSWLSNSGVANAYRLYICDVEIDGSSPEF